MLFIFSICDGRDGRDGRDKYYLKIRGTNYAMMQCHCMDDAMNHAMMQCHCMK
jgi:hypothetical protein